MTDPTLSSQAGPVNIMYELGDSVQRPPIPPKESEPNNVIPENGGVHGHEEQYQQQVGSFPARSPSGFAPQVLNNQQYSSSGLPPVPQPQVGTSHSPQPSIGYALPQEAPLAGRQQSVAATSIVSPSESYRESLQTLPDTGLRHSQQNYAGSETSYGNHSNAPAAPHYHTPVTGYYVPPVQYNPNQSYGVGTAPYPPQSPPPAKQEYSYYGGDSAPLPPTGPPAPPAGAVAVAPAADPKKKKKMCGMTVTAFSILSVILFLIIAGAVLGGVFGSGVLKKNSPDPQKNTGDPTSMVLPTSFVIPTHISTDKTTLGSSSTPTPSSSSSSTYAYPIPTGTWTMTGGLTLTTGSCISNLNSNTYKEVWYCHDNQTETVVVKDFSTTNKLNYVIDIDDPVRARGVQGVPPTGPDTDKGQQPFWTFSVPYKRQAFQGGTGCEVSVELVFLLGRSKALHGFLEQVYSPKVCVLPYGGNSTAAITCGCGYI